MRRNQLTITYPEGDARQLHQALLLLKRSQHLNVSAFCRAAIAEKLEQLEKNKLKHLQLKNYLNFCMRILLERKQF